MDSLPFTSTFTNQRNADFSTKLYARPNRIYAPSNTRFTVQYPTERHRSGFAGGKQTSLEALVENYFFLKMNIAKNFIVDI